jgi:hypothetical protein
LINTWNPLRAVEQGMIGDLLTMRVGLRHEVPELDHPVTRYVRAFWPSELRLLLGQAGVRTDQVYGGGERWTRQALTPDHADYLLVGTRLEGSGA